MHKSTLFIVLFVFCEGGTVRKQRAVGHSSEEADPPTCDDVCEAQWKSDFQVHFQKIYEDNFFDVPIDGTIISTRQNLLQFCSLTEQKFACKKRECRIREFEWSSEKHVCSLHLNDFKKSIECLKKTHRAVHKECSSFCQRLEARVSPLEEQFINDLSISEHADSFTFQKMFKEQNGQCHFIACHEMCHEYVIDKFCDSDQQARAKQTVRDYYNEYMKKDFGNFLGPKHGPIFSSFCRRVTPGADENEHIKGMTPINNKIIGKIAHGVRKIVAELK